MHEMNLNGGVKSMSFLGWYIGLDYLVIEGNYLHFNRHNVLYYRSKIPLPLRALGRCTWILYSCLPADPGMYTI